MYFRFYFSIITLCIEGLPNMDCKDVEEIFKGVLTDEVGAGTDYNPQTLAHGPAPVISTTPTHAPSGKFNVIRVFLQ